MELSRSPGLPFRLVGELVVIVVGILLALSAEAWWSDRVDADEERRYLSALRGELLQVRDDATDHIAYLSAQIDDLARFTDPRALREAPRDSLGQWMARGLYDATEFETTEVVIDELQASGRIGLLSDPEVRRALTYHTQLLARLREVEELSRDTQLRYVDPFLMHHGDFGLIGRSWNVSDAVPDATWPPRSLTEADGLLNLANKKIVDLDAARRRTRELIAHLDLVLNLLQG